jgi:hypothetical protein
VPGVSPGADVLAPGRRVSFVHPFTPPPSWFSSGQLPRAGHRSPSSALQTTNDDRPSATALPNLCNENNEEPHPVVCHDVSSPKPADRSATGAKNLADLPA